MFSVMKAPSSRKLAEFVFYSKVEVYLRVDGTVVRLGDPRPDGWFRSRYVKLLPIHVGLVAACLEQHGKSPGTPLSRAMVGKVLGRLNTSWESMLSQVVNRSQPASTTQLVKALRVGKKVEYALNTDYFDWSQSSVQAARGYLQIGRAPIARHNLSSSKAVVGVAELVRRLELESPYSHGVNIARCLGALGGEWSRAATQGVATFGPSVPGREDDASAIQESISAYLDEGWLREGTNGLFIAPEARRHAVDWMIRTDRLRKTVKRVQNWYLDWRISFGEVRGPLHDMAALGRDCMLVFTRDCEPMAVRENTTLLDFAFLVHSRLGRYAVEGRSDQRRQIQLDSVIRPYEQLTVVTASRVTVRPEWLSFVKSRRARKAIRRQLGAQPSLMVNKANRYAQAGKLRAAEGILNSVVERDRNFAWAWNRLGHIHRLQGDRKQATACFRRGMGGRHTPYARCGLGMLSYQYGQPERAIRHFLRALKDKPDYINAQLGLVRAFATIQDTSAARAYADRLLQTSRTRPMRHLQGLTRLLRLALQSQHSFPDPRFDLRELEKAKLELAGRKILGSPKREVGGVYRRWSHVLLLGMLAVKSAPNYMQKAVRFSHEAPGCLQVFRQDLAILMRSIDELTPRVAGALARAASGYRSAEEVRFSLGSLENLASRSSVD